MQPAELRALTSSKSSDCSMSSASYLSYSYGALTSSKNGPLSFTEWLVSTHAHILRTWGKLFMLIMLASLSHPDGRTYWFCTLGFILALLNISLLPSSCPSKEVAASASKKVSDHVECRLGIAGRLGLSLTPLLTGFLTHAGATLVCSLCNPAASSCLSDGST